jgi:hypothetical protein
MITDLKKQKFSYEPGVWNPNSVLLGGLGTDPLPDPENDPLLKFKQNLLDQKSKSQKFRFFISENEEYNEEYV